MNTRVQVEHPVTEWITGVDIVRTQIMVAAGENCRSRSGRSRSGVMPSSAASMPKTPTSSFSCRDALPSGMRPEGRECGGLASFTPITSFRPTTTSMIGKIIVHGDTREQALARMRTALSETVIEGINTNVPLHRELMVDAKFMDGGTNIHYLEEWLSQRQR